MGPYWRAIFKAQLGDTRITALLDSGAVTSYISPWIVEQFNIPWRLKKEPYSVELADNKPPAYRDGKIIMEIKPLELVIKGIKETRILDIIDLGSEEILLGYNWLKIHNLEVNWFNKTI